MQNQVSWRCIWPRALALALVTTVCLLLPSGEEWYSVKFWFNRIPGVEPIYWAIGRQHIVVPFFFGLLVFFLLGCADIWLIQRGVRPQLDKKLRMTLRAAAMLLATTEAYWLLHFFLGAQFSWLPSLPLPFSVSLYIIHHPSPVLGSAWCICAVLWQLSLLKKAPSVPQ